MWVYRLKGTLEALDPILPGLFDGGARGLWEREGEVWAFFPAPVDLPYEGVWEEVGDEDWLEAWRRDLKPALAPPFVVLAPWHTWEGAEIPLVIEPGMAFGTGHHETTRLALKALARHLRPGDKVLDLGTGSGVLAIAAEKLGGKALGVDIDPMVLPQAEANAKVDNDDAVAGPNSVAAAKARGAEAKAKATAEAEAEAGAAPAPKRARAGDE